MSSCKKNRAIQLIAETTCRYKNRQFFCNTRLLMFQTFVFCPGRWLMFFCTPAFFSIRPRATVRCQPSVALFSKVQLQPTATIAPTRAQICASGGFRFFAFTASLFGCISLITSNLWVKASPFAENPLSFSYSMI